MSLISDALKKARQEAAQQDSLRPGLPYAVGAATAPAPRAPWISLLAALGAGCLLAAAVFALAFFAGWGPFHKTSPQTQIAAAPPAPAPAAPTPQPVTEPPAQAAAPAPPPPKPVAVVEAPAPKPAPESPKREPEAVRPAPQPQTSPVVIAPHPAPEAAPQPAVEAPAPAPAPAQAAPAPATPSQSAPEGGLTEGSTYTGELPVPGGGVVKLNGIVYSPDHPIAVLDGRVMGPGENVQGFTVVAIESGRVKLQGHGATVYLAPK
jgi:hypothetical protein